MKFTVNFNTGAGNETVNTIEEAMDYGKENATYTQQPITIEDENGKELYIAPWWGVEYDPEVEENKPLKAFGSFGYYGDWVEC